MRDRFLCEILLNRLVVTHRSKRHPHPEGGGGGLDLAIEQRSLRCGIWVEDDADPRDTGSYLLQQLGHFPMIGASKEPNPVMLPPGHARL